MSDDELAKALAYEIGIFGGRSSPDGISLTYQDRIKDPADNQLALF